MGLYPKGRESDSGDDIGLFLYLKNEIPSIKVKFTLAIMNAGETEENSKSLTYTFYKAYGWGYSQFIKREELFRKAASLLPKNTLTIMCKVFQNHNIISCLI